jgi:hypothetical protein
MRYNRKTGGLAVTPLRRINFSLSITEIWQLRRREKAKSEIAVVFIPLSIF